MGQRERRASQGAPGTEALQASLPGPSYPASPASPASGLSWVHFSRKSLPHLHLHPHVATGHLQPLCLLCSWRRAGREPPVWETCAPSRLGGVSVESCGGRTRLPPRACPWRTEACRLCLCGVVWTGRATARALLGDAWHRGEPELVLTQPGSSGTRDVVTLPRVGTPLPTPAHCCGPCSAPPPAPRRAPLPHCIAQQEERGDRRRDQNKCPRATEEACGGRGQVLVFSSLARAVAPRAAAAAVGVAEGSVLDPMPIQ